MDLSFLPQECLLFLQDEIAAGTYPTMESAIVAAVFSLQFYKELQLAAGAGCAELDSGRYTELDEAGLREYFDRLIPKPDRQVTHADASAS
jgi:hypothetical protein